ncbi:MAG: VCBS repeat-containing protein, partial [Burkholderiales bacterium]|nr:VCBS repeat-containing protein [Burkholderiales bacterium]
MPKGVPTTRGADGKRLVHWLGHILGLTAALFSLGASAQLSVSESGSPIYSHPIAVPPGIGNLVPNIGLLYAAGGVNGPVGHGWSIQGMSAITRCAGIRAIDGSPRAVDFSGNDKLCLDGQRLIQTDANGAPSAFPQLNDSLGGSGLVREYRTEKDSGARIRAYDSAAGVAANGPAYFKVWTKGGQIYEYGDNTNATAKAAITVQGDGVVSVWAVSRISDTLGNYIDFQYEQREVPWGSGPTANSPTPGKEWNLLEIRYTGTSTAQPRNRVQFVYSDRPVAPANTVQDRAETYHQGKKNVSVRRLDAVKTYTNWAGDEAPYGMPETTPYPAVPAAGAIKVKAVKLAYEQGPVTNRSRVKTITECVGAAEAQCLPPVKFNYAGGGDEAFEPVTAFNLGTLPLLSAAGDIGVLTGDFNGDGRTDLIRWTDDPNVNLLYFAREDGSFEPQINFNVRYDYLVKSDGCFFTYAIDLNGDGLTDLLRYSNALRIDGTACPSYGQSLAFISAGDGTFVRKVLPSTLVLKRLVSVVSYPCNGIVGWKIGCDEPLIKWTNGANFFLIDVNGDGLLDIITTTLPAMTAALLEPGDPCLSVACTRVYLGDGTGNFSEVASNLLHYSLYTDPAKWGYVRSLQAVVDVNGDGLLDLRGVGNPFVAGGLTDWTSNGDDNFTATPNSAYGCKHPIDVNGDGKADCLFAANNGPSSNSLLTANGISAYRAAQFNLVAPGNELVTQLSAPTAGIGVEVIDINGDGRSDLLRWADQVENNTVYLSRGDGSFTASTTFNLNSAETQLRRSDGSTDFVLGDFTGSGSIQMLRMKSSPTAGPATANQLYRKVDRTVPDQLVSVTGSTGLKTDLTWVSLASPDSGSVVRYTSDRSVPGATNTNAAVYPMVDVTAPIYVVTKSETDIGVDIGSGPSKVATEYSYTGLKANLNGRGLLGFREVRRQSPGPNGAALSIVTQYLQDFPYTGSVKHSETRLGTLDDTAAQVLSSSGFWYCDKTAEAGAEVPSLTFTPGTPCPSTAKVVRPYLR